MPSPTLLPLKNPIKTYAWGDRHRLQELFGIPNPGNEPQAEIWMGAHPASSSQVEQACGLRRLDELIAGDPAGFLGRTVAEKFDGRLPFLFKVLNAGQPLSIQLHPDKATAEAGFAEEEARGVARDSPERNYADPNHKPELICALTPFRAMCGFRPYAHMCEVLELLSIPQLAAQLEQLQRNPGSTALQALCRRLLEMPDDEVVDMLEWILARAPDIDRPDVNELCLLHEYYPGDRGVVFALLLNRVELQPGEALFLAAGHMHSYLGGVGLEIMANSDNVIRGGLTGKHVDCPELMKLATFEPVAEEQLRVAPTARAGQSVYRTPVDDFSFALVEVNGDTSVCETVSAEVLFCITGGVRVRRGEEELALAPGESCLVTAVAGRYELSGEGRLARAGVAIP